MADETTETTETAAPAATGVPEGIDPAVWDRGKKQYLTCSACHGMQGEGMPNLGPPFVKSEWVVGPVENLARIQLRGLQGPITVNGIEYNPAAPMAPLAYQTDEQIAAVLTYIRNSFGNSASPVTPDMIAKHRDEVGQPMLTVADLIPPIAPQEGPRELQSGVTAEFPPVASSFNFPYPLFSALLLVVVLGAAAKFVLGKNN